MSFTINNMTLKNFMSVGNVTQAVHFNSQDLTLVLGENLDLGGDDAGARNGVGKTTILNGLSYALYGIALTKIKKDNLINKTNQRNMIVTVEFERNNKVYHIERGRKYNILKFWAGDDESHVEDEAQGDSRETQKEIEKAFGMSHDMFKHILALNTYTEPFLAMRDHQQRAIIEQLLGITLLSEKAEILREQNRVTKRSITSIEAHIAADQDANERIQEQIDSLKRRQRLWKKSKQDTSDEIKSGIKTLSNLDIDNEIQLHSDLTNWFKLSDDLDKVEKGLKSKNAQVSRHTRSLETITSSLKTLSEEKCHTCGQKFCGDKHHLAVKAKEDEQTEIENLLEKAIKERNDLIQEGDSLGNLGSRPETFYSDVEDAYNHKSSIVNLEEQLRNKLAESDPYAEQIEEMQQEAIKEISYDELNAHSNLKNHQEFLYKLLTNKDSFIRKRIIEQNLAHLNNRLSHYLEEMGLPHQVKFLNDLSVEITELGRDLDFDNLSRGERNRLILSLSWSFRDVWEALYQPINLLFIDELVDSGLDSKGVDAALGILKGMSRERGKSVWLVSHRDELVSRVNSILKVSKENGYTNFSQSE